MAKEMRRKFDDRAALIAYLRAEFPQAAQIDDHSSEIRGGRKAAESLLPSVDPARYARTRNFLRGAITRVSPYIRYGVLSLAELRDLALTRVAKQSAAAKFVRELGWRDYFQRLYAALGDGVWQDRDRYKTGLAAQAYADELPPDIAAGETGLACMDAFSRELRETGWLHNHARMWVASYVVHWRRVKWQAGARWFLTHLLDGDPASNNLSWQWVASTFSRKAYIFNRDNLEKYTDARYCIVCPKRFAGCPFQGDYSTLAQRLFPPGAEVEVER